MTTIREFVEELMKVDFYNLINETMPTGDWVYDNREFLEEHEIEVNWGASKVVFTLPYWVEGGGVIKFPYINCYDNYCQLEKETYDKAVEKGIEKFFAYTNLFEVFSLKYYDSEDESERVIEVPCYFQEYAECDEWAISDEASDKLYKECQRMYNESDQLRQEYESLEEYFDDSYEAMDDLDRIHYLMDDCYEAHEVEELIDFIEVEGIDDLHFGNFGVRDNQYILVDFSGYHG